MNPGGGIEQPFGHVKFTIAHHSSSMPDGSYGGVPGGFLLSSTSARVYFACDTALFLDMKLIGSGGLDLAVLPIGDLYTMGPDDSIDAIKLLNPKRVAPCHYNTWPPIAQDAAAWAERVRSHTAAEPIVLEPGGTNHAVTAGRDVAIQPTSANRSAVHNAVGRLRSVATAACVSHNDVLVQDLISCD